MENTIKFRKQIFEEMMREDKDQKTGRTGKSSAAPRPRWSPLSGPAFPRGAIPCGTSC